MTADLAGATRGVLLLRHCTLGERAAPFHGVHRGQERLGRGVLLSVLEECARFLAEAQRQVHEELNAARAASSGDLNAGAAHRRPVQATFRRADEAQELDRLHWEAAVQDTREGAEFMVREM